MIETVVKSPLLPSTIHFNHTNVEGGIEASEALIPRGIEVMRITRDGVWVNPEIEVDEIAKSVLDALDYQIKMLVQSAVEEQREWVGLTDEEIDAVLKSCNTTDTYKYFRAIEAKLKDKNT